MAAKSFVRRARRAAAQREASSGLPFWKRKTLAQMSKGEWEALCDGCGMCCVNKLEYEGTGELAQTDTCCKLLDPKTALCRDYKNRKKIVPDCIALTVSRPIARSGARSSIRGSFAVRAASASRPSSRPGAIAPPT